MKLRLLFILLFFTGIVQAEIPVVQWARSFGGDYFDLATGVVFDSKGNSYVAGYFYSSFITIGTNIFKNENYSGGNMFLVKYDQLGNIVWAKSIKGNNSVYSIAIDKFDNIYVGGSFRNESLVFGKSILYNDVGYNNTILFIAKYDLNGNEIWAKGCINPIKNTEMTSHIYSICVDKDNNIHAIGTFKGTMSIDMFTLTDLNPYWPSMFIMKLDSNGKAVWIKDLQSKGSGFCNPSSIAVDPAGNTFVTGYFNTDSVVIGLTTLVNSFNEDNYDEIFIAKFDQAGNSLWAKSPQCKGSDIALSISVDKSGNAYIGGCFGKNLGFQKTELCPIKFDSITLIPASLRYNIFLAKYNSKGKVLWAKTVPPILKSNSNTGIYSIFTDNKNNVYTTGFYRYSITFDSISLSNNNGSISDIFINKSDSMGNIIWAKTFGGDLEDAGLAITGDNKGNLFLAGDIYSNNLILGKDSLSSVGDLDVFVAKILLDTTHIYIKTKVCAGDSVITLTAPSNNSNYIWKDKNNKEIGYTQSLIVKNIFDSVVYVCTFKNQQDIYITYSCTLINYNLISDFSTSLPDCKTNSIQFTNQSTTNRDTLNYLWDFGDGKTSTEKNPQHEYDNPGKHIVKLQIFNSSSGCTDSISKSIEYYLKPLLKVTGDSTICQGQPAILKAEGAASYQWSTGSTDSTNIISKAQKIWVIGTSASGCVSDTAYVQIKDITPKVSITGKTTYCPGLSITLKANGALHYEWSTGEKTDSIVVNSNKTVWVIGYNTDCPSDTVSYSVSEEPDFNLQIEGNPYFCKGETTVLTAQGADSYLWSNGAITKSITVSSPGVYSVTGRNERGCEKTMSLSVDEVPLPNVEFTVTPTKVDSRHNTIKCAVVAQSGVSYSWQLGDDNTESGAEVEHSYNITGNKNKYEIILTAVNQYGCENSASKIVDVTSFIPNVFTPNNDGINDIFMAGYNLEILDRNGMSLYKGTSGWDGTYKGSKMPDDTYYYVIIETDISGQNKVYKGFVMLIR